MEIIWVWLQFLALASVIGFAGYQLTHYADLIAEHTGLSRNWIGLILLATVTSLPELMTGISAVRLAEGPNLAVGDVLGSCVFNLVLVFFLDLLYREQSVYSRVTQGHLLSGALGMILISFVGFGLVASRRLEGFQLGHLGAFTLLIPALYLLSIRLIYAFEKESQKEEASSSASPAEKEGLRRAYSFFGLAAIVVIAAGLGLPIVGQRIQEVMGWNEAFVGTLFIAFATSLPEIAVTLSAVRLRAIELSFSNLLGSNLFNVVILFIDDLFYTQGPLLKAAASAHAATAFSAVMMTGLVLVALIHNPKNRIARSVSGLSLLLLLVYVINAYVVFHLGGT